MKALRQASVATGKSLAELIRCGVDEYLSSRSDLRREDRVERGIHIAGRFSSGASDVSTKHDKYLAEAFRR